jgi:hypothetical protein
MANDIGHFFAGSSDRDAAVVGIANPYEEPLDDKNAPQAD